MKKIVLLVLATVFASFSVFAQDMTQATDEYNNGAAYLSAEDYASALSSFQSALSQAEACGEDGAELVANCKNIIPSIVLAQGKELVKGEQYDAAITKLQEAVKVAEEYGNAEAKADAAELIPQVRTQKGNSLLKAKDFAGAAAAYNEAIADDPDNGNLYIRLGSALNGAGQTDEAIAAFTKASELGQEAAASKQLSNLYLKKAQASLKAQKYQDAIDDCEKSNSYLENANAYKIAASAASKLSKNSAAIEYYEKYLEVAPNAKDAEDIAYTVAVLSQQSGNKAKAVEYYQKVASSAKYGEAAKAQIKALQ